MKKRIAYILRVNQSSVKICVYQLTYRTVLEDWTLKIHSPQLPTSNTRNLHFFRRFRDLVLHLVDIKEKDFILVYFNIYPTFICTSVGGKEDERLRTKWQS